MPTSTLVAYPVNNSIVGTDISQPTTTTFTLTAGHTYLIIVAANGTAATGLQFGAIVEANGTSIGTLQSSNLSGYNSATALITYTATASTTITVFNAYAASVLTC